ncbi:MAG: ABC transporter ATP-binding protein, partial [Candidatus Methanomethylophilus sp.]|nr:ABC transporter ATP-binding protein [Methanomethylophilus sp.]
ALAVAQAEDFVAALPEQEESHISQKGKNLSGGQKQRIAIARAVCRDPEIYILDDSFSALDYKTDKALREALRRETEGSTVIIVAQRIGTIRDADEILVLDEGRIVGRGKHRQLMESCPLYREIARSQLTEEELL